MKTLTFVGLLFLKASGPFIELMELALRLRPPRTTATMPALSRLSSPLYSGLLTGCLCRLERSTLPPLCARGTLLEGLMRLVMLHLPSVRFIEVVAPLRVGVGKAFVKLVWSSRAMQVLTQLAMLLKWPPMGPFAVELARKCPLLRESLCRLTMARELSSRSTVQSFVLSI